MPRSYGLRLLGSCQFSAEISGRRLLDDDSGFFPSEGSSGKDTDVISLALRGGNEGWNVEADKDADEEV